MGEHALENLKRIDELDMEHAPEGDFLEQGQENDEREVPVEAAQAQEKQSEDVLELPMLPVRSTVLFPNVVVPHPTADEVAHRAERLVEGRANKMAGRRAQSITPLRANGNNGGRQHMCQPDSMYVDVV